MSDYVETSSQFAASPSQNKPAESRDPSPASVNPLTDDPTENHLNLWVLMIELWGITSFAPNTPDPELGGDYQYWPLGNPRPVIGCGANYLECMFGIARLGERKNPVSGKVEEVKFFKTYKNEFGREMAIQRPIAFFDLITNYHSTKHSASEWGKIVAELLPLANAEREVANNARIARDKEEENVRQIVEDRQHPQRSLAMGIALALRELGLKPKEAK